MWPVTGEPSRRKLGVDGALKREETETVINAFRKVGFEKRRENYASRQLAFLFLRMANTKLDFSADGKGPVDRERIDLKKRKERR